MTLTTISRPLLAVLFVLIGLISANIAAAGSFHRIVVFGDSLSDPGNAFVVLRNVAAPPFSLIPDAPYARGGLHFSNGRTWVEDLADGLRLNISTGPALAVPHVFSNYAVGGARARPGQLFDLTTQVGLFLRDFGGSAPDDALYVIFIGANDVRDALSVLAVDPSGATSGGIINAALTALRDNITVLASSGARTFLVANAPNLALVPAVRLQGSAAQGAAQSLATAFNNGLAATVNGLQVVLPVRFARLDVFGTLNRVVADPATAGLSDVQNPCITPDTNIQPFCTQPDRFLFWDGIHPTRAGHAILARDAAAAVIGF
jgi:phospholipase/lecithinase/hemolysin